MIPEEIEDLIRRHWKLFLVRGLAALAFGVLTLLWPGATLIVLMAFIAAYALVDGIFAIVSAFRLRPAFKRWWLFLIQGVISTAFGVLAFFYPALSLAYIVVSVALWMVFSSAAHFALARVRKAAGASGTWHVVGGILSLVLAAAALLFPGPTVIAALALVAWFSIVGGMVNIVLALRAKSHAHVLAPATGPAR
jgi:uncharacterized membrane protein HdeD (DUF308 family)